MAKTTSTTAAARRRAAEEAAQAEALAAAPDVQQNIPDLEEATDPQLPDDAPVTQGQLRAWTQKFEEFTKALEAFTNTAAKRQVSSERQTHGGRKRRYVETVREEDGESSPSEAEDGGSRTHIEKEESIGEELAKLMEKKINLAIQRREDDEDYDDSSPFTKEVEDAAPPKGFKVPTIEYDGTTDPVEHLNSFKRRMRIYRVPDAVQCQAFSITLRKAAATWFNSLKAGSISCFDDFERQFRAYFAPSRKAKKTSLSLMSLRQKEDESLRDFIRRFNNEAIEIQNLQVSLATAALMQAVRNTDLRNSLSRKEPKTLKELRERAQKYVTSEEVILAMERRQEEPSAKKPRTAAPGEDLRDILNKKLVKEDKTRYLKP